MSIESVMPSNHLILSSPSPPALNLSQHQGLILCQGPGGLCSQRQEESLGHAWSPPPRRPRSRPPAPDGLSRPLVSSFHQLPHNPLGINFNNETGRLLSAALRHRPDEGLWLPSSVWGDCLGELLSCVHLNSGQSFGLSVGDTVKYS